jgi:purine-binding chemotaxis protein CheW
MNIQESEYMNKKEDNRIKIVISNMLSCLNRMEKLLVFALSDLRCALQLSDVDRILHAVEISPVPRAPEIVMGLINVQGCVVPVLNIRKLLRLSEIEITLNDQIILVRTASRLLAVLVDNVLGVAEFSRQDIITPKILYPGIEHLEGVTKLEDGILYIYNLDKFLSSKEKSEIEHLVSGDLLIPADRRA